MLRNFIDRLSTRQRSRIRNRNRSTRRTAFKGEMCRDLRVEPLEDRRLLVLSAFATAVHVEPGEGYDGVVGIDYSNSSTETTLASGCTGSLLTTGRHILTAGHCVADGAGVVNIANVQIVFEMPDRNYVIPAGTAVAPVAADEDEDGVEDAVDDCLGTPTGEIVDASGCSISQICPCDEFKNHGQYVSCTARAVEDFVQSGIITEVEADMIVETAAHTSCGKKSKKVKE